MSIESVINLRENRISHNFTGGGRTGTTGSSSPLSLFPGFAFGRSELSGREISSTCEGVLHSIIPLKFLGPNLDLVSIHLSRSPYTCTCSLHPHPIHIPYVSPELMTAPQLPSARLKKLPAFDFSTDSCEREERSRERYSQWKGNSSF